MKARPSSNSGFTLFEIIIALAIVGLIMGIAIGGMDRFLELDMKKASNKLAATIRYLYNKSASEGLYIRLVLDVSEQNYWVEATTDPVRVAKEDKDEARKKPKKDKTKDKDKDKDKDKEEGEGEEKKGGGEEGPEKLTPKEPTFGQVDSFLLKPTKLPQTVFFKDVYVEHRTFPIDGGKASIFFFPNGYVESAVINLRDEDDEVHYSLKTNPISGRVSIENFYRNLEEE